MLKEWRLYSRISDDNHQPTPASHDHNVTDTRWHDVLYYRHLDTSRGSLLFDVSVLDRTSTPWALYFAENYLLNFSAVFSYIHPFSTIPIPVWKRVQLTSSTGSSHPFVRYPRRNHRSLESTPSSYFIDPLAIARSPYHIWQYHVSFGRLPETLRSDRRINHIPVTKDESLYASLSLDVISNEKRKNNFAQWTKLLVESNQASL